MAVLYYEEIEVGTTVNVGEYEITKDEVVEFASKWDPQPFHVDEKAAEASIYGGLIASGSHVMAIRTWLLHRLPDFPAILAGLGWDEVRFLNPARVGDQLSLTIEFLDKRESQTRPDRGIVHSRITVINQEGTPVLVHKDAILVAKREKPTHS